MDPDNNIPLGGGGICPAASALTCRTRQVWTPEDFLRVDDTILKRIEFQRDPALRGAQALLGRLRRRELYRRAAAAARCALAPL